ncbi:protein OXIDATIVE STRESS 3 LIKE 2-like [Curcuma longa]|uniref:protein OXIDATIVE STRESS 3 LIKE 2-like n=1 Tax=Curcuma longa TaxID=136217 RepID=UPI003D9F7283
MSSLVLPGLGLSDHLVPCSRHRQDQALAARKRPNSIFSEEGSDTSIGVDSEEEEEEEEVESKKSDGALGSLDALEDSLPIKRGLSNFYSGKARCFANLADAANANVADLAKRENPFNKRRRLLLQARTTSFSSLIGSPTSPPPDDTPVEVEEEEEEGETSRSSYIIINQKRPIDPVKK